ncbi:hypothetical protein HELRODRAFT_162960 [Helobdella robusta]|uniref:Uncharacterized protein n=1 Tax=Helobdella robusta TaxID=6412 RepID=T1ETF6_HELRO|nr:hypothetical protein HELRODRAFT_162960 [Helobdella robusta]ESN99413.1 hypothetical protein HELRODRAFT_162960 [Helobdella robusta]
MAIFSSMNLENKGIKLFYITESLIKYAAPSWCSFVTQQQLQQLQSPIKKLVRLNYLPATYPTVTQMFNKLDSRLIKKDCVTNIVPSNHCSYTPFIKHESDCNYTAKDKTNIEKNYYQEKSAKLNTETELKCASSKFPPKNSCYGSSPNNCNKEITFTSNVSKLFFENVYGTRQNHFQNNLNKKTNDETLTNFQTISKVNKINTFCENSCKNSSSSVKQNNNINFDIEDSIPRNSSNLRCESKNIEVVSQISPILKHSLISSKNKECGVTTLENELCNGFMVNSCAVLKCSTSQLLPSVTNTSTNRLQTSSNDTNILKAKTKNVSCPLLGKPELNSTIQHLNFINSKNFDVYLNTSKNVSSSSNQISNVNLVSNIKTYECSLPTTLNLTTQNISTMTFTSTQVNLSNALLKSCILPSSSFFNFHLSNQRQKSVASLAKINCDLTPLNSNTNLPQTYTPPIRFNPELWHANSKSINYSDQNILSILKQTKAISDSTHNCESVGGIKGMSNLNDNFRFINRNQRKICLNGNNECKFVNDKISSNYFDFEKISKSLFQFDESKLLNKYRHNLSPHSHYNVSSKNDHHTATIFVKDFKNNFSDVIQNKNIDNASTNNTSVKNVRYACSCIEISQNKNSVLFNHHPSFAHASAEQSYQLLNENKFGAHSKMVMECENKKLFSKIEIAPCRSCLNVSDSNGEYKKKNILNWELNDYYEYVNSRNEFSKIFLSNNIPTNEIFNHCITKNYVRKNENEAVLPYFGVNKTKYNFRQDNFKPPRPEKLCNYENSFSYATSIYGNDANANIDQKTFNIERNNIGAQQLAYKETDHGSLQLSSSNNNFLCSSNNFVSYVNLSNQDLPINNFGKCSQMCSNPLHNKDNLNGVICNCTEFKNCYGNDLYRLNEPIDNRVANISNPIGMNNAVNFELVNAESLCVNNFASEKIDNNKIISRDYELKDQHRLNAPNCSIMPISNEAESFQQNKFREKICNFYPKSCMK